MRAALRNVAALVLLALGAGGAIAWFAAWTEDDARRNRLAAETRLLRELAGVDIDAATAGDLLCQPGLAVLRGVGRGYGGGFRLAVAFRAESGSAAVAEVRIIEHAETPGFGDILDAGSAWLDSFRRGEVHAVTGVTVTSEAVMQAVRRMAVRIEQEGLCPP